MRPHFSDYQPVIFSAITNTNYPLSPWQRQPHIDQGVTAMMHLNPEGMCAGGTGLYRHRPTGLERLPIQTNAELLEVAREHGFTSAQLKSRDGYAELLNTVFFNPNYAVEENRFINNGNEYRELLYLVEMRPNRLVIFDGRLLHSQHITPDHYVDYDRTNRIFYFQGHD